MKEKIISLIIGCSIFVSTLAFGDFASKWEVERVNLNIDKSLKLILSDEVINSNNEEILVNATIQCIGTTNLLYYMPHYTGIIYKLFKSDISIEHADAIITEIIKPRENAYNNYFLQQLTASIYMNHNFKKYASLFDSKLFPYLLAEYINRNNLPEDIASILEETKLNWLINENIPETINLIFRFTEYTDVLIGVTSRFPRRLNIIKETIIKQSEIQAKKHLRDIGKTFVIVDGVNPVTELMTPIVDALNAPLFIGIEEALNNIGYEIEMIDRTNFENFALDKKDKIFYGIEKPTPIILFILNISLGVDAYNDFIRIYNEGENN